MTATQQQHVIIDVVNPSVMNKRKKSSVTLMDEFAGLSDKGDQTRIYRFRDETGQPFSPKTPYELPRDHPHFQNNLDAAKAYKALYRPELEIFDPLEAQSKELQNDDLELEARNLIAELKREEKINTAVDMLRRLEGIVGDITPADLWLRLNRLAKAEPRRILTINTDPDYEIKVLIDKAVELNAKDQGKGIQLQDGKYYKFADGRMIADGVEEMVYKVKNDAHLKAFISGASVPSQVIAQIAPITTDPADTSWMQSGDLVDNSKLENKAPEISDERIDKAVSEALTMGYFEKGDKKNYLPGDVPFTEKTEAVDFYRKQIAGGNPALFTAFEEELRGFGITL